MEKTLAMAGSNAVGVLAVEDKIADRLPGVGRAIRTPASMSW